VLSFFSTSDMLGDIDSFSYVKIFFLSLFNSGVELICSLFFFLHEYAISIHVSTKCLKYVIFPMHSSFELTEQSWFSYQTHGRKCDLFLSPKFATSRVLSTGNGIAEPHSYENKDKSIRSFDILL